jgi:hypothetical protein
MKETEKHHAGRPTKGSKNQVARKPLFLATRQEKATHKKCVSQFLLKQAIAHIAKGHIPCRPNLVAVWQDDKNSHWYKITG